MRFELLLCDRLYSVYHICYGALTACNHRCKDLLLPVVVDFGLDVMLRSPAAYGKAAAAAIRHPLAPFRQALLLRPTIDHSLGHVCAYCLRDSTSMPGLLIDCQR